MKARVALLALLAAALAPAAAIADHPGTVNQAKVGTKKASFEPTAVPRRVERALGGDVELTPFGGYRVDLGVGPDAFTHGPDPVTRDLSGGKASKDDPFGHKRFGNEPTDAPVCAASATGDYYQHIIYMYRNTNRLDAALANDIFEEIAQMNYALNRDSIASGGPSADYKVLCNASNQMIISAVQSNAVANFNGVTTALRQLGFNKQNADYTVFYDGDPTVAQCGVGMFAYNHEELELNNPNNLGNAHGITWVDCWDGTTPMHENGHNQGAVGYNAPQSTGSGAHCFSAEDIMCYNDNGDLDPGFLAACANPVVAAGELDRFDCGFDTYFDSAVEADEPYLDDHWNMGSPLNRFIAFGAGGGGNQPPVATFTYDCDDLECQFTDQSSDDAGIALRHWNFGEGGLASSQQNPTYTYNAPGTYPVSLRVEDGGSPVLSDLVEVPVSVGDGTPTRLLDGIPAQGSSGAQDTFERYTFKVPRGARKLIVRLSGADCAFVSEDLCVPDLDLYGDRFSPPEQPPTACKPFRYGINERCNIRFPQRGRWHLAVHNFAANPATPFTIEAETKR